MSVPDASQHDPKLSEGYPYICRQLHDARPQSYVPLGAKGKVIKREFIKSGFWVCVTLPYESNTSPTSWVPMSYLEIGKQRKYGDMFIEANSQDSDSTSTPAMSLVKKVGRIVHFAISLWVSQETAAPVHPYQNVNGMLPGPLRVLNSPKFTINDLRRSLTPVGMGDGRPAIYTRIYWNFISDPYRRSSQYCGKSVTPGTRDLAHDASALKEIRSNHYRTMSDAHNKLMGILCYLNDPTELAAAEQLFVNLFGCYTDPVLNFNAGTGAGEDSVDIANSVDKYYADKEAACVLTDIAEDSFKASGWTGSRFNNAYSASNGCNWNSPVTEMFTRDPTIWIKSAFPDQNIDVFRRSPVRVQGRSMIYIVMETQGNASMASRDKFCPTIPSGGPKEEDWVYPSIEVTRNGRPHHLSWANLPDIGAGMGWDEARSWARKIEWQNNQDVWKSTYLCSSADFWANARRLEGSDSRELEPGAHNAYAQGLAVYRYLRQKNTWGVGRAVWQYDYGIARVKEQTRDWLASKIELKDINQNPIDYSWNREQRHPFSMAINYMNRGLRTNVPYGDFGGEPGRNRTNCDSCYLLSIQNRWQDDQGNWQETHKKEEGFGLNRCVPAQVKYHGYTYPHQCCERCKELGRVCTWTRSIERCPMTDPKVKVFVPHVRSDNVVFEIPDPNLQRRVALWEG